MPEKEGETEAEEQDQLVRAPDYRKYYATNVISRLTDSDIRVDFFNERVPEGKHFLYVADAGVILTFEAAAILRSQLARLIKEREDVAGEISVKKERTKITEAEGVTIVGG